MPAVNPELLKWARTTAGLTLEDAASGLLNDAYGKTAVERLAQLEAGGEEPTRALLNKMAKKYNRPLITFYLREPPRRSDRGQDFRTLTQPVDDVLDARLDALLRKVKASQEIVRDLLEDEEVEPLGFIGSATINQRPEVVANDIVATIGFDISQFRAYRRINDAFEYLRDKVQSSGIFVILARNLGSHHTNIPLDIFRGFVIADDLAPYIVINDGDAISARAFTLLHELTHLWLGTTGISGDIQAQSDNEIERFCNQVAAQILLTPDELNELRNIRTRTLDEAAEKITDFAEERNISRSMVAYQLLISGQITNAWWQRLSNKFYEEWLELVRQKKDEERGSAGGPNYYVTKRSKLGRELTGLTSRAMSSGALTPSKASVVLLGVKIGSVHELVSNIPPKGSS